jgi:hypothetical protein
LRVIDLLGDRSTEVGRQTLWHHLHNGIEAESRCPDGMVDFCLTTIRHKAIESCQWYAV